MQRHEDVVQDKFGNAVRGAEVSIIDLATGELATLFDEDESTPLANPLTTDDYGVFGFRAANGRYRRRVSGANVPTRESPDVTLQDPTSLLTVEDVLEDFTAAGLLPSVPAPASLSMTTPAGVAYIAGQRVAPLASGKTYTASRDTYADLGRDGSYTYVEVLNGAAAPAVTANALRQFKVVTDATAITAVTDLRQITLLWKPTVQEVLREELADPSVGDLLVVGKRTLANAVAFTLHLYNEARPVYLTVDFGLTGTGDETTAIQMAIDSCVGRTLVVDGLFTANGLTIPSESRIIGYGQGAGFTGTGTISAKAVGNKNILLRGMSLFGSLTLDIGGTGGANNSDNTNLENIYVETDALFGIEVFYADNSHFHNITVNMTGSTSNNNHGFKTGNCANSSFRDIKIYGNLHGGFSASGTGSGSEASLDNCLVEHIYVYKTWTGAVTLGQHGVYLLGMNQTHVFDVKVVGDWIDTSGSEYDFKFRDSWDCTLEKIKASSIRISADNNTVVYVDTLRNKMRDVICDTFAIYDAGAGTISDLTIEDIRVNDSFESQATDGPIYLKGDVYLGNTGDIRLEKVEFEDAIVEVPNINTSTNRYRFGLTATRCRFKNLVHVYNSNAYLRQCRIDDLLRMDSSGGTTYLELENSYVDGSFFANSYSTRVMDAKISNTTFNAAEDSSANNNPDVKTYRNVSFTNKIYISENKVTGTTAEVGADVGDAAKTLTFLVDEPTQIFDTPLTAPRAVTLSATNAAKGAEFEIVRTANATGASALNVGTGPLAALAVGQWCRVKHNGTSWFLSGKGSL